MLVLSWDQIISIKLGHAYARMKPTGCSVTSSISVTLYMSYRYESYCQTNPVVFGPACLHISKNSGGGKYCKGRGYNKFTMYNIKSLSMQADPTSFV